MYSKKTVEVNNIDAEGRLVLADGCSYAHQHLNPRCIIDMATLTGAQGVATGKRHGAIYTNDEGLELSAVASGKASGDLVHPMPYCPEFFAREFDSDCADMTNSVADRSNAQVSCAAQFVGNHIEGFLDNGGKWLHIDMAYPVHAGERATGYGVALLYDLVKSLH
jgi:probable aminopeptidase NPEPL1